MSDAAETRPPLSILRTALAAYRSALRSGEPESEQLKTIGDAALAIPAGFIDQPRCLKDASVAIQERKHAAQTAAAGSASDGDFDLEAYWRARSEGLAEAEKIVRAHLSHGDNDA